ncbi:MAG TPA: hypothetical protein VGI16_10430 [Candidatus Acidoferrum sp.]|jgi:flagellar biosynthesis chaperone FliJ
MAFRYPLQSVLRLRASLERQEEQRLFAIAAIVAKLSRDLEQFDDARLESQRAVLYEMAESSSGAAIQFASLCDAAAAEKHGKMRIQLIEAERLRTQQVQLYRKARQKREVFESLRKHQAMIYEREAEHREQERTDEAFLIRRIITHEE